MTTPDIFRWTGEHRGAVRRATYLPEEVMETKRELENQMSFRTNLITFCSFGLLAWMLKQLVIPVKIQTQRERNCLPTASITFSTHSCCIESIQEKKIQRKMVLLEVKVSHSGLNFSWKRFCCESSPSSPSLSDWTESKVSCFPLQTSSFQLDCVSSSNKNVCSHN